MATPKKRISPEVRKFLAAAGRKGGLKTTKLYDMKVLGRKGGLKTAEKRRKNI